MWRLHAEQAEDALRARADFLAALEREAELPLDRFRAQLIYTELVGNVVRHATGPVDVELKCVDGKALLHVFDRGGGFELQPSLPESPFTETGRGLFLVQQYAERLQVHSLQGHGTCVSAIFSVA